MTTDRDRIRDISVALGKLDVEKPQSLEPILAEIRALTELDSVAVYSLADRNGHWELGRFEAVGDATQVAAPFRRLLQRETQFPLYVAPPSPPREQRNKVIDSIEWIERKKPGTWEQHPMNQAVLRPLGFHHHRQPRALLYEGTTQLAWFGALHATAATKRQIAILSALVEPMRRRLAIERRLFATPYLAAALSEALERLGAPAFIVNGRGTIFEANKPGRALLSTSADTVLADLRAALASESISSIEIVSISQSGEVPYYLAIVRNLSAQARTDACLDLCQTRWRLTKRQREVLALVVAGLSNADIAQRLECVERTVELHVSALLDRADVESRAGLVAKVLTSLT